ncbi:cache domain-containing protein [Desulforamulus putei]|uniref:cache domain-containing protein n=1 Tax=Desulforamulus putei TaxID=74701 RepID=UPI002FDCDBE4
MKSIRCQITLFVLLLTLLPLAVSGFLAYNASNQMAKQAAEERMTDASNVSRRALNRSQNEISMLAEMLSQNQLLAQALQKGDRAALQQLLQPAFQIAQKSFPINTLEVTDAQGIVLMRGHNPDKFGDNKKDHEQISKALSGQFVKGLTISQSTGEAALDAVAPVMLDNQLVGTVKAGLYINNQLAEFLGKTTNSDVFFFYNIGGRYLLRGHTALPEGDIFKKQGDQLELTDTQLISQLVKNKDKGDHIIHKRLKVHGLDHFVAFAPLSDHDGQIRGIVVVAVDAATLQQSSVKMHSGLILNTVLAGLLAALLALWYAGRLTRPIIQVADAPPAAGCRQSGCTVGCKKSG